jgi:hypothetical protein
MSSSHLSNKLTAAVVLILTVALALTAFLSYVKYERLYAQTLQSRFGYIAGDLKTNIENSLNLGLPLGELRSLQSLIDHEAASDGQIVAIAVFDDRGSLLFGSSGEAEGDLAPPAWRRAMALAQEDRWDVSDAEAFGIGHTLRNSFDRAVGGLVLRYDRAPFLARTAVVRDRLAQTTLAIVAVAGLIALVGAILLVRPLGRFIRRFDLALASVRARLDQSMPAEAAPGGPEAEIARFERRLHATVSALEQAERSRVARDPTPTRAAS